MVNIYKELEKILGTGRIRKNTSLSDYTTIKVGGPAEFLFTAESKQDLINAFKASNTLNIRFTILGGASNVLVGDKGIGGIVVLNKYIKKRIIKQDELSVLYEVSSGYPTSRLAKETVEEGLSGFEYHLGLPGTMGGAIVMNSKWTANPPIRFVSDTLLSAETISLNGDIKKVSRDYFKFSLGYSMLQKQKDTLLLKVLFRLIRKDPRLLKKKSQEVLTYRVKTQPFGISTSGCFFRNIGNKSAGKIIDDLGLKGAHVGGAYVSEKHANFIENREGATSKDIKKLAGIIKEKVREKYGYNLQEEVEAL